MQKHQHWIELPSNNASCRQIEDVSIDNMKELTYVPIPDAENWKIRFVKEIQEVTFGNMMVANFDSKEIKDVLEYVCTS